MLINVLADLPELYLNRNPTLYVDTSSLFLMYMEKHKLGLHRIFILLRIESVETLLCMFLQRTQVMAGLIEHFCVPGPCDLSQY